MPTTATGESAPTAILLRVLTLGLSVSDARRVRKALAFGEGSGVHGARSVRGGSRLLRKGDFDAIIVNPDLWTSANDDLRAVLAEQPGDAAIIALADGPGEAGGVPDPHAVMDRTDLDAPNELAARIREAVARVRESRRSETMARWLERDASTDRLTGLANRKAFEKTLTQLCAESAECGQPIAVLLIEVSDAESVVEAYGQDEADTMLRHAAEAVARCTRGLDAAARLTSDTLVVAVPDGSIEVAQRMCRRIAQQLEQLNAAEWRASIPTIVSFGLASGVGPLPAELVAAAGRELSYREGRRRLPLPIGFHDEDGPSVA